MSAMLPPGEDLEIDAESLARLRAAPGGPPVRLIDCREPDEYALCRIEGAELIPLSRFGEECATRLSDPDQAMIVYCHHGMRSLSAVRFLRKMGFRQTWSLHGGIDVWSDRIDPTVPRY